MPLFHENKLYFVHIPKTGGTSIDSMFYPKDIMNIIYSLQTNKNYLIGRCEKNNNFLLQHCPISYILNNNYLDETTMKYKRFAIVRNPYDRLVSSWKFSSSEMNFSDFIHKIVNNKDIQSSFYLFILPQYKYIYDDDLNLLVDDVLRFENYDKDILNFFEKNNIDLKLKHENKTVHDHYSKYFNEELYKIVNEYYGKDFELFGYKKD